TGDNADADDDNDGTDDGADAFPLDPSEDTDTDGDGTGDNADVDDDGTLDGKGPLVSPAEAFTPNGDGINDTWVVPGIDNYPDNTVKVFNRWGQIVFEVRNYGNDWEGSYNGNKKLPIGSYLYVIDLGEGSKPIQGWIYMKY
ncbi:gliding motility-associated C-terminal domain-containing protein, partial [Flagellimonas onchidii]|uniref:gliding motility-associated C-terminal domain-containing protein n=1 Tax=Flagellimonas onchidii TaxID=2562684 RepID=UPI00197AA110